MIRFLTSLIVLFSVTTVFAQKPVFQGVPLTNAPHQEIADQFYDWEIYQIDAKALSSFTMNAGDESSFHLELGDHDWDIMLQKRDLRSTNYITSILTDEGVKSTPASDGIMTYRGQLPNQAGWTVALTLSDEFIYGYFEEGSETYFIEPLWYFVPGASKDQFIVYSSAAVKPDNGEHKCGALEMQDKMEELHPEELMEHHGHDAEKMMACVEIELAIAADLSMFNFHGSVAAVNAFTFGVMNDVQTNYDNEFNDELHFNIVEQFVVAPPATDPWTNSNNAGTLLNSFTSWGPGGFSATHDIGQLWTKRNLDGGTVGIAWVSAVCTSNRYHVVSQFTSTGCLLRVMTGHEIGHNFSAGHDAPNSGFIMQPSVSCSTTWSSASQNSINNYYPTRSCLGTCTSSQPPVANFSGTPTTGCNPLTVDFTDLTTNNPIAWNWTFPGGSPASSSQQNPTVVYATPGTYNVTLVATNTVGSNSVTKTGFITVLASPIASFTWSQAGLTLIFTNTSTNGTSYLWNFGDGGTSTQPNPTHTYAIDGIYDVTLSVTNACGTVTTLTSIPVYVVPTADFTATPTTGCAPLSVSFVDLSSPNSLTWSWNFPGGTPSSSVQQFPSVTYNAPGSYTVSLTVTNPAGGDNETKTGFITVGDKPTVDFTSVINGNTANFTSTVTNPPGSGTILYSWDFGDGGSSTLANPSHTYAAGGSYGVTLTVTNTCGSAFKIRAITILVPPVAGFTANTTSGCTPLTVNFTSTSSGANSYAWTFPGGTPSTSTMQNPTVVYTTAGSYDVTLVVTNPAGSDTLTQTNYVIANTTPVAGYTSSVSGTTATFTNTSTNATSYAWAFGDGGTSTLANPTHTYATDGVYTVVLSATNACGTVTSSQTVTIVTPPTAGFTANNTTGCAPLTVQFTNQSSANATTFAWTFPGGTPGTSSAQNPSVTYSTAGTYTVTLTASNSAGSNTSTQTNYITVNTTPLAGYTSSVSGTTATFTNTSTNATSYGWTFGDGGTSTLANPTHTYATDGVYTVVLSATNTCGTVTSSQTVTIVTPPTAGFSANNTTGCAPLTVQFNNSSSVNATTWAWSFPGGTPTTSTAQNPSVSYATPGTYSVTLIASNSAGSDTTTLANYITAQGPPAAGFTAMTNVFVANFTNTTTNGTSYAWTFGDGGTSTATNPSHTYPEDGVYTVVLTATGPCGTATATQQVSISSLPVAGFNAMQTNGCAPFTVQFQDQSSSNTTTWAWSFPGGTPATSTVQNPSVTYSTPGSYNVSLTASNPLGMNTAMQTNYITVGTVPTAGFTAATTGLTANFTNSSAGATSYSWNFGDGQNSTQADPSHTYTVDGTYTVVLTSTNACGTATSTQTVVAYTQPTAGFDASTTSGCAPLTVQFSNQSSANAETFSWSFPGGTPATSTAENPTVVYNTAGTYTVTLTVSNPAGQNTSTQTNYITVNTAPAAGFTGMVAGTTVTFNNMTTNATSYAWDFGDSGSSTMQNPSHTYATDGVYEVTLTATNECGSTEINGQFSIVTPPTAGFSAAQTSGCAPLMVTFNNESSANATSFAWSFPGGMPANSTQENPVVTYNTAGTYDVMLTVTNSAGSDTYTLTSYVTVSTVPTVGFTSAVNGASVMFTNTSANATSYLWTFGDGGTSMEANPIYTYTADDVYTVTLTATNECGQSVVTHQVVIATTAPQAFFSAEPTTGCAPITVVFNNESSANAQTFEWSFPGGTPATSTEMNPTVTYSAAGSYNVTLIATNPLGSDTYEQTGFVVVSDVPTPAFTRTANFNVVTFNNTSTNATSYEWNFGDGSPISTEPNPVHTYAAGGQYMVTLTATNECGTESTTIEITVQANGVDDIPGISRFDVFPNPNSGRFTLVMEGAPQTELELSFTNVLGQRLLSEKADFRSGHLTRDFSFSQLSAGVYILQVKSGEKAMFKKLVIE
ncbi:MAG: PKD domain-containing protein [Saprospiraceae bacterium]|nr:PKD domain-containing protein [Saprospiraceae bacterium]MCF8250087.1 PKD domain-containing protein [Saprospiraceae bacterium]MCF8279549.1 PKD domain-containing protein [Bacteroidales bacterium]MCF8311947.1 PKD domain-containing protein [Saprospiraceae bacterium]MCF8440363.1 PKD domain-containing protein [Saprospiraceae bacterium]